MTQPDPRDAALARIRQMADYWEKNLPEVIRTPAVVSAIRAALERAEPVAVSAPPAGRAAVLREAADKAEDVAAALMGTDVECGNGAYEIVALLRRLAGEAQQDGKSTAEKAADLGLTDTEYRSRSHAAAVATIRAAIPGMYASVGFRLEDVLNGADEAQQDEEPGGEAHPPEHAWRVESPRRERWVSWGATYDERRWAFESFESAISTAPARAFRVVRATTTFTVEAEHTPGAVARSGQPETDREEA
jgi:hypothetical protein